VSEQTEAQLVPRAVKVCWRRSDVRAFHWTDNHQHVRKNGHASRTQTHNNGLALIQHQEASDEWNDQPERRQTVANLRPEQVEATTYPLIERTKEECRCQRD
jgi:hypothetical protein